LKWKSTDIIEIIQENKNNIRNQQTSPYKMQLHTARTLNQNKNSTSIPIITANRSILGVAIAIVAFTLIPTIPIIITFFIGYWIAKNANNK
jgi:hypothetical protein